jgi:hypothetical protein
LAKYSEIHSEPYVCTFVNTSPRWQAKLIWKIEIGAGRPQQFLNLCKKWNSVPV